MTGIGGDVFCLFYEAKASKVHALNGSGRSSAKATLDAICDELKITDRVFGAIPNTSIHSVTVPGAAAGWVDIIDTFGSGETNIKEILRPAIRMARNGVPISEISSYYVRLDPFPDRVGDQCLTDPLGSGYEARTNSGASPMEWIC